MKKLFTLITSALFAASVNAQDTVILSWNDDVKPTLSSYTDPSWEDGMKGTSDNVATWSNGYSIMIMRSDKAYSSAKDITIDGQKYKTIKLSNFAQNKLTLPEGKVTKKITLYSYVNKDAPTERPSYWAEVAGVTYEGTEEEIFENYSAYDTKDPDKREFTFEEGLNEVTFTNTGEQCCFVLFVEVEDAAAGGDDNKGDDNTGDDNKGDDNTGEGDNAGGEDTTGIEAVKTASNSVIINLAGQKVDSSYKGIVVKDGKKYVQK